MAPDAENDPASTDSTIVSRRLVLTGHVQGVGFRPHVYRVATGLGLKGWVQNRMGEVYAHAQGPEVDVQAFLREVIETAPPLSAPTLRDVTAVAIEPFLGFEILDSEKGTGASIFVPVDTCVCEACLRELRDPADRRHRYPFINCTQCGPRYTLIEAMPYDRPNTTMAGFPLCEACRAEYEDPANRRFHAEPVACPRCGPSLRFVREGHSEVADTEAALTEAVQILVSGGILAMRGIGGYHLMCDARNEAAVSQLRARKRRPAKPFAIMVPQAGDDGLDAVRIFVTLSDVAGKELVTPRRPIILLPRLPEADLAPSVAPGCGELGLFLPYSPLHTLLLDAFDGPLVATSANLSGEPVLTNPDEIDTRLVGVADAALHHNRPIARPADDPVLREIAGAIVPFRLGRGTAPVELSLRRPTPKPALALGSHMKATVALAFENRAVVSPHIGEMDAPRSLEILQRVSQSLQDLYDQRAEVLLCDAHSGYTTHRWARTQELPMVPILHHHAHASALAGEYPEAEGTWLTFTWDGVGLGQDGTLWGGDALLGRPGNWQRVAHFRSFRLTGGDRAGREPWRSAAALCWDAGRDVPVLPDGAEIARQAWEKGINTHETTAAGRLFDAAACLVSGMTHASFEAQGPMQLEAWAKGETGHATPVRIHETESGMAIADWASLLDTLTDSARSQGQRAADFHASMAQVLVDLSTRLSERHAISNIGLTGGVFQNARLVHEIQRRMTHAPDLLRLHRKVPCNDASISFGQVVEYAALAGGSLE
ncbi:carbamoyltransferase HypF [Aliiruegeria sabulilitoris]|uniref:carbamoyltransferase HypF n=1 Tax=Aliiruegeria sabulilitoris TaxID=1510458 RepID=UPI000B020A25|nr:carbamoyltransferase HypF [Aliiruegeria sabulilitoris]